MDLYNELAESIRHLDDETKASKPKISREASHLNPVTV